jgi:hypothetical protein
VPGDPGGGGVTIEEGLFTFVTAQVDVAAIIGTRFYAVVIPQEPPYPVIVHQRMAGPRERAADGPTSSVESTYALTCWAKSYAEATTLARVLRKALDGTRGPLGDVSIGWATAEEGQDLYEETLKLFGRVVQLSIQHTED